MEPSVAVAGTPAAAPARSGADAVMHRLLRIPDVPRASAARAERVFGQSLLVSMVRCLLTYVVLPVLGPVVGLAGGVGPVLGLTVGTVSMIAIVVSIRRFWLADHRMRWPYTAVGGAVLALLAVQAVGDISALLG